MVSVLVAVQQMLSLAVCCGIVYALNQLRPNGVSYRPLRLISWIPALLVGCLFIFTISSSLINFPHLIQSSPAAMVKQHSSARSECVKLTDQGDYLEADKKLMQRWRHTTDQLEKKEHVEETVKAALGTTRRSVADQLEPYFNWILFSTGVFVSSFPIWVRLAYLALRVTVSTAYRNSASLRAEWSILLPIINFTTVISCCTAPYYFFILQPQRGALCIYTSGHWYTTACTVFTFIIILAHLYVYYTQEQAKEQSNSSPDSSSSASVSILSLFQFYVGWFLLYLLCVSTVLRVTQRLYHDEPEANDGMRRAIPAYIGFMIPVLIVQYITFNVTKSQLSAGEGQMLSSAAEDEPGAASAHNSGAPAASPISAPPVSPPAAPSSSSAIPDAPAAPPAPSMDFAPTPAAPAMDFSPSVSSSSSAPSLADQLAGAKLRQRKPAQSDQAEKATPTATDSVEDALRAAIRGGVKLKKVERPDAASQRSSGEKDGLAAMLLKLRRVVEPDEFEQQKEKQYSQIQKKSSHTSDAEWE